MSQSQSPHNERVEPRNEPPNSASSLLTLRDVERLHAMKRRQRFVEYAGLVSLQGFLAAGLVHATNLSGALGVMPVFFAAAWLLAQIREKRRILDQHDPKRHLGDTIESFSLAFSLALLVIGARWLGLGAGVMMTYLSLIIASYFLGSFVGELWWSSRVLPRYDFGQKINYVMNLNRSLIFPYNLRYLKSIFRDAPKDVSSSLRSAFKQTSGSNDASPPAS